jgi:hypothetical protein
VKFVLQCYMCKWSTVVAAAELENWIKHHAEDDPTHSVTVRCVQEAVPEDIPDLVKKHQVWIDSSRARIIALEKLVDMLVVGAVTRGECTVNRVRDLKYGME